MRRERNFIGPAGMGGTVGLWGASSLVQSVQYGTISLTTTSNTATITLVDTTRSFVVFLGAFTADTSAVGARSWPSVVLTNATTVTASTDNMFGTTDVGYLVIQFMPGIIKRIQVVNSLNNNGSTGTAVAMSEVNLAKTLIQWSCLQMTANSYLNYIEGMKITVTSSTSLLFQNGYTGGSPRLYALIVEFF